MTAFYNEIDPYAAAWLRNLIKAGLIPDGEVSTHSIVDLRPSDLSGFDQCHFFAGIGGWSQALRLAGWAPDRPVWTGSCPCQPFSVAGKGAGTDDPRHLWPHFHRLIQACRPPVVLGEQVAGKAGYGWFDGVRADLEATGYAGRAVDIPALAVNAPHIRQRLYWVALDMANAKQHGRGGQTEPARDQSQEGDGPADQHGGRGGSSVCSHMADTDEGGRGRRSRDGDGERNGQAPERDEDHRQLAGGGEDRGDMADAASTGLQGSCNAGERAAGMGSQQPPGDSGGDHMADANVSGLRQRGGDHPPAGHGHPAAPEGRSGHWDDHVWIAGSDGKARRAKPGIRLLVNGVSNCLANVLSICEVASKRITDHAERSQADPSEVLRMVREHLYEGAGGKKQSTGVCGKLYAPQVLFDFMLSQAAARNGATDSSSIKKAGKEKVAGAMRIMRMDGGFVYPSCQWQSNEQQRTQSSDPLHELSFLLACDAQAFGEAVFDAHAAINRVGMLRAYGNAIVAPLAAEVVKTLMETLDET
jgi:DNA (cytosine-5)-methyltransferase 1